MALYGTRKTEESTPNGEGNYFHRRCMEAISGESVSSFVFLPWFLCDDYRIGPDDPLLPEELRGCLRIAPEEKQLMDDFGLDEDQIRWRRYKIKELDRIQPGLFYQEYAERIETCFLVSATPAFPKEPLLDMLSVVSAPKAHYDGIDVWVEPLEGHRYSIAADPASGVGKDYSAATVTDLTFPSVLEHVATIYGKYEPNEFAALLARAGYKYNNAWVVPERNEYGHGVLNSLIFQVKYPWVYHSKDLLTGREKKAGWLSNAVTKKAAIADCRATLADRRWLIRDERIIRELLNYRREADGSFGAGPGMHDDLATCIIITTATGWELPRGKARPPMTYGRTRVGL
jgi:hypothetical protein